MPNQPRTPVHSVRVDDETWQAAKRIAEDRGETLAEVIRRALLRYIKAHPLED